MRPRGHIQSRSPGSYRLRYSLGRNPVTGKRRIATTTVCGTRSDAERELTRLLRTADTGEHVDPSRMAVGQWLELWLDTIRTEVSPKTHESYAEIVRCYLTPAFGSTRLDKLAPSQIQKAHNSWMRQDGKPLSPRTRRYIHVILKSSLARPVEQQTLARNPPALFNKQLPKVERKKTDKPDKRAIGTSLRNDQRRPHVLARLACPHNWHAPRRNICAAVEECRTRPRNPARHGES